MIQIGVKVIEKNHKRESPNRPESTTLLIFGDQMGTDMSKVVRRCSGYTAKKQRLTNGTSVVVINLV
jgi:hypothetical protein